MCNPDNLVPAMPKDLVYGKIYNFIDTFNHEFFRAKFTNGEGYCDFIFNNDGEVEDTPFCEFNYEFTKVDSKGNEIYNEDDFEDEIILSSINTDKSNESPYHSELEFRKMVSQYQIYLPQTERIHLNAIAEQANIPDCIKDYMANYL